MDSPGLTLHHPLLCGTNCILELSTVRLSPSGWLAVLWLEGEVRWRVFVVYGRYGEGYTWNWTFETTAADGATRGRNRSCSSEPAASHSVRLWGGVGPYLPIVSSSGWCWHFKFHLVYPARTLSRRPLNDGGVWQVCLYVSWPCRLYIILLGARLLWLVCRAWGGWVSAVFGSMTTVSLLFYDTCLRESCTLVGAVFFWYCVYCVITAVSTRHCARLLQPTLLFWNPLWV